MNRPRMNPNLLELPIYPAGKSVKEIQQEYGLARVINMASNESPIGPSPLAVQAYERMLTATHQYPSGLEERFRKKLANRLHPSFDENNIIIGNGSTDLLRMITQAFVFEGGNAVMSRVASPIYRILTMTHGGSPRLAGMRIGYRQDLGAIKNLVDYDTRIVFLCSPNNPSGESIDKTEADAFISKLPKHVVIVFDEAYHDFVDQPDQVDTINYCAAGHNVLSLRSFSAATGLANLRVGYLVGPRKLTDYVRQTVLPFNSGDIALAAAEASLYDTAYLEHHIKTVILGRNYLESSFRDLGLSYLPSQGNFVTIIDVPIAPESFVEALLRRGILVKPMGAFGLPNALRFSVGTLADNEKLVSTLDQIINQSSIVMPKPRSSLTSRFQDSTWP